MLNLQMYSLQTNFSLWDMKECISIPCSACMAIKPMVFNQLGTQTSQ